MSLKRLLPDLRAACRERVLTVVDVDHRPDDETNAGNGLVYRNDGESWLEAGFSPGCEITCYGFGDPVTSLAKTVAEQLLTLEDTTFSGTAFGPDARFVTALPQARAWEGEEFTPVPGKPYVAETFRSISSVKRSVGNANGTGGTIEHRLQASFALFYPAGLGTLAIESMAGALMAHFFPGLALSYGAASAIVTGTQASPPITDGGWITLAVTVSLLTWTSD